MQNPINEDELQKAIDDITNSSQDDTDVSDVLTPADAGAAPDLGTPPDPAMPPTPGAFDASAVTPLKNVAPVPEGEAVAEAPVADPVVAAAPVDMTAAPVDESAPMGAVEMGAPAIGGDQNETTVSEPAPSAPGLDSTATPEVQPMGAVETPETTVAPVEGAPQVQMGEGGSDSGTEQIKADILRDLSGLMDKVEIEPEKKFHIYRDMMTTNNDKSVIPAAYETAKLISDEQKRGEALVSLIEAIEG